LQVAVVVERLDQEMQGRAVFGRQAQGQGLAVQMLLQGFLATGQVDGIGLFVVVVVLARRRIAAPFAVVGRRLDAAIALPAGLVAGTRASGFFGIRAVSRT
jgi:hypothetical protein